jgi:hypothetical protein
MPPQSSGRSPRCDRESRNKKDGPAFAEPSFLVRLLRENVFHKRAVLFLVHRGNNETDDCCDEW